MIINSPVGRFPFVMTSVRRRAGSLVLHGEMGNWPTSVEIRPADILPVLVVLRPVLLPALTVAVTVATLRRRDTSRTNGRRRDAADERGHPASGCDG